MLEQVEFGSIRATSAVNLTPTHAALARRRREADRQRRTLAGLYRLRAAAGVGLWTGLPLRGQAAGM